MNQKHNVTFPGLTLTSPTPPIPPLPPDALSRRQFGDNPTLEQMFSSSLDPIYVGNEEDMLMIEGSGDRIAEEKFIEALAFGHQAIQPVIAATKELQKLAGKPKQTFKLVGATPEARAIIERVVPAERVSAAIFGFEKNVRSANVKLLKEEAKAALTKELGEGKFTDVDLNVVFEDLQYKAYRATVQIGRASCRERV